MPDKAHPFYRKIGKRLVDVLVAVIGLFISAPLNAVVSIFVVMKLGRPIIFRQIRPGLDEKPFWIYKYRTMTDRRDARGSLLPDSDRLTPFGELLRKTSLDELPELFCVLKGDMSMVGPRPLLMRYLPFFREDERARFQVKPGISGLAQIMGRNDLSWDDRFRWDIEYSQNISFALDMKIMGLTILRVFRRRGIRVDPRASMLDLDEQRAKER